MLRLIGQIAFCFGGFGFLFCIIAQFVIWQYVPGAAVTNMGLWKQCNDGQCGPSKEIFTHLIPYLAL